MIQILEALVTSLKRERHFSSEKKKIVSVIGDGLYQSGAMPKLRAFDVQPTGMLHTPGAIFVLDRDYPLRSTIKYYLEVGSNPEGRKNLLRIEEIQNTGHFFGIDEKIAQYVEEKLWDIGYRRFAFDNLTYYLKELPIC